MESTTQQKKPDTLHPTAYAFRWQFAQEHPAAKNLVGCDVRIHHHASRDDDFAKPNNRWQGDGCFGIVGRYSDAHALAFEVAFKAAGGAALVAWFAPSELEVIAEPRLTFDLDRVKPEAYALATRAEQVTWDELQALRANSYERKLIHRNLTDDALVRWTLYSITQSGGRLSARGVPTTYPEAVTRELAPLVLERWQASQAKEAQSSAGSPGGALTYAQLVAACANVGVDLTCGACAAIFYTGAAPSLPHECKGGAPSERELLASWFRSAPNPHFEDVPLWVLVKEAFLVGSTRASEICRAFGQDPDRKVPGRGHDDGVCMACRAWRCPECEELSHVPDGSEPKCDCCEGEMTDE